MTNPIKSYPSFVSQNAVDEDAVLKLNVDDLNWQGKQTTSHQADAEMLGEMQ